MKTKKITTKIVVAVIAFILALFVSLPVLFSPVSAFGTDMESTVSGVLTDLQKDENFDTAKYPAVSNDYSLQVIQIAETTDKELLVYVYQPAHDTIDLTATSINISTAINESLSYKNYKLALLDNDGVFDKYQVEDFTIKADALRYYDISSIYRARNTSINDPSDATEVAYEVAKLYTACTVNDSVTYTCLETEVVTITSSVAGTIRYSNGVSWGAPTACDSHFVAFSCDYDMDKLMEADLYYVAHDYVSVCNFDYVGYTSYTTEERYAYLTADQTASNTDAGWFAREYTWKRIETVSSFLSSFGTDDSIDVDFTEEELNAIAEKEWCLKFVETNYNFSGAVNLMNYEESGTKVSDITILRLKFEMNGEVYNLGVVHNKINETIFGDADTPFDDVIEKVKEKIQNIGDNLPEWAKKLIAIALILLLLAVCSPFIPYLVKAVIWIVSLPFKLLGAIFKGIKKAFNNKKE